MGAAKKLPHLVVLAFGVEYSCLETTCSSVPLAVQGMHIAVVISHDSAMLHLRTDSFPRRAPEREPSCRETAAESGHFVAQCCIPQLQICVSTLIFEVVHMRGCSAVFAVRISKKLGPAAETEACLRVSEHL